MTRHYIRVAGVQLFSVGVRWILLGALCLQSLVARAQGATPDDVAKVKAELGAACAALADPNVPLEPKQRQTLAAGWRWRMPPLSATSDSPLKGGCMPPPLCPYATGGGLLLDDITVAGIADDVFVPFVALGVLVAHLATRRPASSAELAKAWRAVLKEMDAAARAATAIPQTHHKPPDKLRAFPEARPVRKRRTPVQGGGGGRKRWVDSEGKIYERDSQHGNVEEYDPRGRHLGEYDPSDGREVKGPKPGRRIEP